MTPIKPNTLNNIFKKLNATEAMIYSSFLIEGEDIAESIEEEG